MDRRHFLHGATALGLSASFLKCTSAEEPPLNQPEPVEEKPIKHNPIGVSTYSFWQFNGP